MGGGAEDIPFLGTQRREGAAVSTTATACATQWNPVWQASPGGHLWPPGQSEILTLSTLPIELSTFWPKLVRNCSCP